VRNVLYPTFRVDREQQAYTRKVHLACEKKLDLDCDSELKEFRHHTIERPSLGEFQTRFRELARCSDNQALTAMHRAVALSRPITGFEAVIAKKITGKDINDTV